MNAKTLYGLIAIAIIAVVVAIALQSRREPRRETEAQTQPVLPALRDHINDIKGITLTGAEGKLIVTLTRSDDGWGIAERGGYPADIGKIRQWLVKLDRSTLLEQKTANAQRYADIGVDDVKNKDAKGVRVDIAGLPTPTTVIIGTYSAPSAGTFVRRGDEAQS